MRSGHDGAGKGPERCRQFAAAVSVSASINESINCVAVRVCIIPKCRSAAQTMMGLEKDLKDATNALQR